MSVNMAHTTVMYPCTFNQPLVIGMTIAGIERMNVKKTRPAFAIMAESNVNNITYNIIQDRNRATNVSLGSPVIPDHALPCSASGSR